MIFTTYTPAEPLKPFVKYLAISEQESPGSYPVYPSLGMVLGFQYRGRLNTVSNGREQALATSGITGMVDHYQLFRNSEGTGTVLVYFTTAGFASFTTVPAHELFNLRISLDHLFPRERLAETEARLAEAKTDAQRISTVESFLLSQLNFAPADKLVSEALKRIHTSAGSIRIRDLNRDLGISQSPFEKRFRKAVGASPKKFASIVRFQAVMRAIESQDTLINLGYDHNFYDQAHFTKEFKRFTGITPEQFRGK